MPIQYIPGRPGAGERFGAGLGEGLSEGLGQMLQQKMQTAQIQNLMKTLKNPVQGGSQPGQSLPGDENIDSQQMQGMGGDGGFSQEGMELLSFLNPQAARSVISSQKLQDQKRAREEAPYQKAAEQYWTNLQEQAESLPEAEQALDTQFNAIMNGEVDPFSSGNWVEIGKALGAPKSILGGLETPGSKAFKTSQKALYSKVLRDTFRGTTTGREIDAAEDMLAGIGVKKSANLAAVFGMQAKFLLQKEKVRLAREFKNKGVRASNVAEKVDEAIEPFRKELSRQYFEQLDDLREMDKKEKESKKNAWKRK